MRFEQRFDAARLRSLVSYDPATGIFIRLAYAAGRRADIPHKSSGYRFVSIDHRMYGAHRLAWLYVFGCWPTQEIDHRNGNKADNRIQNLREATHQQNIANQPRNRRNASGFKGAYWVPNLNKWKANIRYDGKTHHLGVFDRPEDANEAYRLAAIKRHGEFARAA